MLIAFVVAFVVLSGMMYMANKHLVAPAQREAKRMMEKQQEQTLVIARCNEEAAECHKIAAQANERAAMANEGTSEANARTAQSLEKLTSLVFERAGAR